MYLNKLGVIVVTRRGLNISGCFVLPPCKSALASLYAFLFIAIMYNGGNMAIFAISVFILPHTLTNTPEHNCSQGSSLWFIEADNMCKHWTLQFIYRN